MPDTLVQAHTPRTLFQANTWKGEQPPSSLIPSLVNSKPELLDEVVVVPVVETSISI